MTFIRSLVNVCQGTQTNYFFRLAQLCEPGPRTVSRMLGESGSERSLPTSLGDAPRANPEPQALDWPLVQARLSSRGCPPRQSLSVAAAAVARGAFAVGPRKPVKGDGLSLMELAFYVPSMEYAGCRFEPTAEERPLLPSRVLDLVAEAFFACHLGTAPSFLRQKGLSRRSLK